MRETKRISKSKENNKLAMQHFQEIRQDIRQEIKERIKQRDIYSTQMIVALASIVSLTATASVTQQISGSTSLISFAYRAFVAAPLVAIYYTTLILYSYRVHRLLAKYMKEIVEPELARLCGTSPDIEWESWYGRHAAHGIRRSFFFGTLWVLCIISPLYVAFTENWQGTFMLPLAIISALYLAVTIWITATFWKG